MSQAVNHIHELLLTDYGGPTGIRDESLLQSALSRPVNKFASEANCGLHDLAAAYAFGIAKNHRFIDGNKRTAFVCAALFLEINGFTVNALEADTVIIMESLAAGTIDKAQLADWFRSNSVDSYRQALGRLERSVSRSSRDSGDSGDNSRLLCFPRL